MSVVMVVNKSSDDPRVTIPLKGLYASGTVEDQQTGNKFQVTGGKVSVTATARRGLILVGTS